MSDCIVVTSLIESILLFASAYILVDLAFREIPKIIVKFRVIFAINILITQIYYSSLELDFRGVESWIAWMDFLRSGTGYIVVIYLLENFIRVLFVVADVGGQDSMELANPLLKCWSIYRVAIMVYSVVVGTAFSILKTNAVFLAHTVGNAVSNNLIIFPCTIVVARLAYHIRQHQNKLTFQEMKFVDDEAKFMEEMEAKSANRGKKGHRKGAPSNGEGFASMQRQKDRKRIKKTERQLAAFGIVVLICCMAWNYSNVLEIRDLSSILSTPYEPPVCGVRFGQILHVITSLFALAITRAPNALKRKWVTAHPWMTTIAKTLTFSKANSSGNRSPNQSADDRLDSKKSAGHFRTPSSQIDSKVNMSQFNSAANSQVNSPFVSPSGSRRGSNADTAYLSSSPSADVAPISCNAQMV